MYEPWQRPRRAEAVALPVSRGIASHRLSISTLPSRPPSIGFSFSESLARPRDVSPLTSLNSSESASSLSPLPPPPPPLAPYEQPQTPSSYLRSVVELGPSSDVAVVRRTCGAMECAPRPTVSSFTVLPSIHFRTIPRPLQVPLLLIPPERVQISPIAGGDLDMTLCVLFRFLGFHRVVGTKPQCARRLGSLRRMNKLGVYFTTEKQDALFRGDTSNAVVNRHFLYGCQTIGTHLCGALDESPTMARLLAVHGQKAWETLIEIQKNNDQRLFTQGLLFFVYSLIIMGWPLNAQFYLLKVCEFIDKANLQFLPAYGRPPGLSEQVREEAAVLSQTIYLENYVYLALGGLAPKKTTKIEREFLQGFQVRTICCRARSGLKRCGPAGVPTAD